MEIFQHKPPKTTTIDKLYRAFVVILLVAFFSFFSWACVRMAIPRPCPPTPEEEYKYPDRIDC